MENNYNPRRLERQNGVNDNDNNNNDIINIFLENWYIEILVDGNIRIYSYFQDRQQNLEPYYDGFFRIEKINQNMHSYSFIIHNQVYYVIYENKYIFSTKLGLYKNIILDSNKYLEEVNMSQIFNILKPLELD